MKVAKRSGPNEATKEELYELAKKRGVDGRSSMTKSELIEALAASGSPERVASRVEQFRALAEASSRGEFVMLPRHLIGHDRRMHVRQTLREDHRTRITNRSEGTETKFNKLAASLFAFFRGTALLFYRDMAGTDSWMPTVLTLGDVHPENFGVMPNANNVPIFAVNDFDEAYYAPFTWDIKRGATGFMIAADEVGGYSKNRQRKIVARFIRGYVDAIRQFADDQTEMDHEMRIDNSPKLIRKLLKNALESREQWLADDYHNESKRGFRSDAELVPISSRRDEFQEIVDRFVRENEIEVPARASEMHVKDVALRKGQGTASLGLARYYVMIEGPAKDGSDDLIIEIKRARRSALAALVLPTDERFDVPGDRIKHAQGAHLVRGDVFYGSVEIDGTSFMTRERAPFRDDIELEDLSNSGWNAYAEICGSALAHAHALSDEIGALDCDVEPKILEAIEPAKLFTHDILQFTQEAADRCRRDFAAYREDHQLGAFRTVDIVYK